MTRSRSIAVSTCRYRRRSWSQPQESYVRCHEGGDADERQAGWRAVVCPHPDEEGHVRGHRHVSRQWLAKIFGGFIASMNDLCTRYYSKTTWQPSKQEVISQLEVCMTDALYNSTTTRTNTILTESSSLGLLVFSNSYV